MKILNFKLLGSVCFYFILLLVPVVVAAADYNIGSGQTYTTIGAFPWSSLVAGDTVYIHAKDSQVPYYEHIYISAALQGTEASPIKIIGVSDGSGNQPIIDGSNSTIGPNFDTYNPEASSPSYHSMLGVLVFGPSSASNGTYPQWVEVSNLTIQNYKNVTTTDENGLDYTNHSGEVIYVQSGEHITLDNLTVTGGRDGIFGKDAGHTKWLTIKNSYIYGNGVSGSYLYHNIYTELYYLVLEGNHFGPPIEGSSGNNIKDRGVGTIIRYNFVEDGGHLIDLVACEDQCVAHMADPAWGEDFVYGNVLYAGPSGPELLVHLGGGTEGREDLYFYNNTVLVERDSATSYYTAMMQITSSDQTVYMDNNIVYFYPETEGANIPQVVLQYDVDTKADGNVVLGANWFNSGWYETRPGYTVTGTISGQSNVISAGGDPSFVDLEGGDYHLNRSSTAVRGASALSLKISKENAFNLNLTPVSEYVAPLSTKVRESIKDIGAYEYKIMPPLNLRSESGPGI